MRKNSGREGKDSPESQGGEGEKWRRIWGGTHWLVNVLFTLNKKVPQNWPTQQRSLLGNKGTPGENACEAKNSRRCLETEKGKLSIPKSSSKKRKDSRRYLHTNTSITRGKAWREGGEFIG